MARADKKTIVSPFIKQCFVTGSVCMNVISHGCVVGYPAVMLPQLHERHSAIPISPEAESWIASVVGISMLVGNFITPGIMYRYGRKAAHYAVTMPVLLGWLGTILAPNAETMVFSRILQGTSIGMFQPLRSVLVGEYTSPKNRGAFLTTITLAQAFGIFLVHLIGSFLSWQVTALVCLFFPFLSLIMIIYSPETPSFLASKGRYEECRMTFRWLRGIGEEDELDEMINAQMLMKMESVRLNKDNAQKESYIDIMKKREFYVPIVVMSHAYFMTQFSGGSTMATYSTKIIALLMGPAANAHFWMVALDSQRLFFNTAAVYFINKFKRRTMMFFTGSICVFSHIAMALYVYLRQENKLFYDAPWISIVLINLQFFSIAVGMVPLPGVIAGEVFPLEYRSIAGSISLVPLCGGMFLVLKTFPFLISSIGLHGTFTVYSVALMYNLFVIWLLLPETKDKTLQQIEDELRGRPLRPEEIASRMSLQADPVIAYKRKISVRRCSVPLLN